MPTINTHPRPVTHADGTIVWRVRFRLKGLANPRSETFPDAESAYAFIDLAGRVGWDAARRARDAQHRDRGEVRSVGESLERHLTLVAATATPGTVDDYRKVAARTWLPRLDTLPVTAVTEDAVAEWVAAQRQVPVRGGGTYSRKSISNAKAILYAVLEREVRAGTIPSNPVAAVRTPGDVGRAKPAVFLSPSDFAALLGCIDPRYQSLVALLYGTGLRWGEATALQARDLDLEVDVPTLRVERAWKMGAGKRPYLGTPKTKRSLRTVTLPASLLPDLRSAAEKAPDGKMLFRAPRGGPLRTPTFHTQHWRPAIAEAGLGVEPRVHDLRHSHASNLIRAGISLPVIQRRLGHESITTTIDLYGHLSPDSYAGAAAAADLSLVQALPEMLPAIEA